MPSPRMPALARAKGIAVNPSAPAEVLLRFLRSAGGRWSVPLFCVHPELPEAVCDAAVAHPDAGVRAAFATGWRIPAAQRARLVTDPSPQVREMLAAGDRPFREQVEELPAEVFARLAADPDPIVRQAVAASPAIGEELREALCADPDAGVRAAAVSGWPEPPDTVLDHLLDDEDAEVRRAASSHLATRGAEHAVAFLADPGVSSWRCVQCLALAPLPASVAEQLAHDPEPSIRKGLAANPCLPQNLVALLAADPDPRVRLAVSMRPELTEEQRMAIDFHVAPTDRLHPPEWVWRNLDHPDLMRMCATSAHTGLRRSAVYSPHLPPELVALLAADTDHAVRLLLCENHPDMPGEILLATYLEATVITRGDLLYRPNFPRDTLAARFAADPDPHRRWLSVLDPTVTPELLDRLSRDPHEDVRGPAAAHERLPAARALELLDDPVAHVAGAAARHPALPVDVMHRLLDEAGVP